MAANHASSKSIMFITIIVAIGLTAVIWPLSMMGKGRASTETAEDAETRIQPLARVEMHKVAVKTDGKPRDGAAVYKTVCMACHASGVAGAPKAGDKAAWAPRLAQGKDALYKSATKGKNGMPPKGGSADLSDGELKAAVDHLTGLAK